jgi:hypothetical protein
MRTYETFELLAKTTWRLIRDSELNRISMGEDAITSYHLTAIAASHPQNVLYEDTRIDESWKGCDFELWVGSDFLGWHRYAIQAKKIKPATGRYEALGHKVGGVRQIDVLKKYARANNATPFYCFYNFSSSRVKSNCTDPADIEQLGCSIATVASIETALKKRGGRSFQFIHSQQSTLPWRCLVKCPKFIPGTQFTNPQFHKHASLPSALNVLRRQWRDDLENRIELDPGGLFNMDLALRPARIAVIDLGEDTDT